MNFRESILKISNVRQHKIKNSIGVYDIYKKIRKSKWENINIPITEQQFYYIIRKLNILLANILVEDLIVKLPQRLGILELRYMPKKVRINNGKLKTNLPIDWHSTLQLWESDTESYQNKQLVRFNQDYIYKIIYNKNKALFTNKSFFDFKVNRDIKRIISQKITEGVITDTYLISEYYK